MAVFSERLRGLREQKGFSQRELANELGGIEFIPYYNSVRHRELHKIRAKRYLTIRKTA